MPKPSGGALLKLALFAAVLAAAFLVARSQGVLEYRDLSKLAEGVRAARDVPGAAPLFVLIYVAATTFGLPGSVLTLAGGALFGFTLGTLLNWLAATVGATSAYFFARTLGEDAVRGLLGKHAAALDKLSGQRGFLTLLRLRLIPIVPFNALNFGSGLAGAKARPYIAATALGIVPGTAVYTYFADALLSGAEGAQEKAFVRVAIAGGLLVLLSFVPAIARKFGWIPKATTAVLALSLVQEPALARLKTFDHVTFDRLLREHVTSGLVDYDAFETSPAFKQYLNSTAEDVADGREPERRPTAPDR